jgi:hypothetical protein
MLDIHDKFLIFRLCYAQNLFDRVLTFDYTGEKSKLDSNTV